MKRLQAEKQQLDQDLLRRAQGVGNQRSPGDLKVRWNLPIVLTVEGNSLFFMATGTGPHCTHPVCKVYNEAAAYSQNVLVPWQPVSLYMFQCCYYSEW